LHAVEMHALKTEAFIGLEINVRKQNLGPLCNTTYYKSCK